MSQSTKPDHTNPLWQRAFLQALNGLLVAGGAAALRSPAGDGQPPPATSNALTRDEASEAETTLSTEHAAPVGDWEAPELEGTVHDLLVEEAALIADATLALVRRREQETPPGVAPTLTDVHRGGRRAPSGIGRVPVLGTQPK